MKQIAWLLYGILALTAIADADESQPQSQQCEYDENGCGDEECDYPLRLPHERAWSYDEELESPTTWPGKREDSFYDWLTK